MSDEIGAAVLLVGAIVFFVFIYLKHKWSTEWKWEWRPGLTPDVKDTSQENDIAYMWYLSSHISRLRRESTEAGWDDTRFLKFFQNEFQRVWSNSSQHARLFDMFFEGGWLPPAIDAKMRDSWREMNAAKRK